MEEIQLSPNALKVAKNFRCLLIGASEAGKSTWISNLIRHQQKIFQNPGYTKFIFCSPNLGGGIDASHGDRQYQERLQEWAQPADIQFLDHIISETELFEQAEATPGRLLLIIDDFSQEIFSTDLVYALFTRLSSHRAIDTCISLHQGVASKSPGRWYSLIFQNCNYLVLFRNIANRASIGEISKRIFPYGKNDLQRCLNEATTICGPYAYITVDASLQNELNNRFGVRTNIFEENNLPTLLFKNPSVYYGVH